MPLIEFLIWALVVICALSFVLLAIAILKSDLEAKWAVVAAGVIFWLLIADVVGRPGGIALGAFVGDVVLILAAAIANR